MRGSGQKGFHKFTGGGSARALCPCAFGRNIHLFENKELF
jgi:hypothetical protein